MISSEFGKYIFKTVKHENYIDIISHFELNLGTYSIDRYCELYNFINSVELIELQKSVLLTEKI